MNEKLPILKEEAELVERGSMRIDMKKIREKDPEYAEQLEKRLEKQAVDILKNKLREKIKRENSNLNQEELDTIASVWYKFPSEYLQYATIAFPEIAAAVLLKKLEKHEESN